MRPAEKYFRSILEKTPQTQPSIEAKQREYKRRFSRRAAAASYHTLLLLEFLRYFVRLCAISLKCICQDNADLRILRVIAIIKLLVQV